MENSNKKMFITSEMTVKQAMRVINEGLSKTVFLVENEILKGSLTDGDIRRHLLKGGALSESVANIVNYSPKYFRNDEIINYKKYMIDEELTAIPIVDNDMKLIRIEKLKNEKAEFRRCENVPVIIMAGGLGTRLKPYTDIIPKPLIPIGKKSIIEHIFDKFELYGCNEKYVIVNYKKKLIEAYFSDENNYNNLKFIEEPFFMGTGGGIKLVQKYCIRDFFITNCDILVNTDYYDVWKQHREEKNIVTMILVKRHYTIPYGTVEFTSDGKITHFREKPSLDYDTNTGMYLCNARIYEYMQENEKIDMPELIQRCIDAKEKVGYVSIDENSWWDMGQMDELENMKQRRTSLGET